MLCVSYMMVPPPQLSEKGTVEMSDLQRKWKNLCLPMAQLHNLLRLDNFVDGVEWMKFFALCCSALGGVCSLDKVLSKIKCPSKQSSFLKKAMCQYSFLLILIAAK